MKFCHNCGAKLEDNMEFCPNCGTVQLKLNRTVQTVQEEPEAAAAEPFEPVAAVEAPEAAEPAEAVPSFERPQPASTLEYGRPPVFGGTPQQDPATDAPRHAGGQVRMPRIGVPTFQGRPVHGEAIADGAVPKGTEGSFSAGYGRGTEQSSQPVPAFRPDQPYQTKQTNWPHQTNWPDRQEQAPGTQAQPPAGGKNGGKGGGKTLLIVLLVLILVAVIAIAAIAVSMVAKGGGKAEPQGTGSSDHVIFEDCEVEIGDGYLFRDFAGDDAIAVEVTWTNKGKNADFADDAISVQAYQDGETLVMTFPSDLDDFNDIYNKRFELVQPGDSITFVACFGLDSQTEPVDIEVVSNNYDGKATCTFTID
ncbi:MAG: DUF5067 domain-containing protein [Firmicutes bacterium]|nr:DUF5067 domain-containing protein [Bacillota bacterium]